MKALLVSTPMNIAAGRAPLRVAARRLLSGAGASLALSLSVLALGCKQNDMAVQPKYTPYDPSTAFIDGASARPLVAGTIARDPKPGTALVTGQPMVYLPEYMPVTTASDTIPFPVTRQVMERGQNRYDIFCSACHGRLGNGNGMIPQRGFIVPPSFHAPRLLQEKDSHFFAVISNGYQAMYSYADRIQPADRWCIVAYIRALQAAPDLSHGPLTGEDKQALTGSGDATHDLSQDGPAQDGTTSKGAAREGASK